MVSQFCLDSQMTPLRPGFNHGVELKTTKFLIQVPHPTLDDQYHFGCGRIMYLHHILFLSWISCDGAPDARIHPNVGARLWRVSQNIRAKIQILGTLTNGDKTHRILHERSNQKSSKYLQTSKSISVKVSLLNLHHIRASSVQLQNYPSLKLKNKPLSTQKY